ncbi:DUF928 domain-containing protein [Phormidium pseudopriestleyi FRX01]|uniref:DUF928 domain-containing protein n=1 Tax=Phormidium pseudopriestleyi FRX01 TaxID=1759528 RepID=A0ABS3FRW0_9CYAN|nr:DUF928 domain-containing protein [Phormidium pseudopriestleyi]MBO0349607.1 DUF928 domain-containing protein [Phormidium pseudopriestleyi FRX01]
MEIAQYVPPKGLGAPPTVGGGTRGGRCDADNDENRTDPFLTVLMPKVSSQSDKFFGATGLESPEFLVYIPQTVARSAEFVLKDEQENDIYRVIFPISGQEEITSLRGLSDQVKLEPGKNYVWYFSLICEPDNLAKNVESLAWSHRIEQNPLLNTDLETTDALTRSKLYAQSGMWHEAIATLAELRREQPNDPTLIEEWKILLESAGLSEIANWTNEIPITVIGIENTPVDASGG